MPPLKMNPLADENLSDFGKTTLTDRYLLPGESFQDLFARVAQTYADDEAHAQRLYDYMSNLWFMPATPILSNGGAGRGLPISCFLNSVDDSLGGIRDIWNENIDLASKGGGIGTYWGSVRSMGEAVAQSGETSGIIPFIKVMDSLTLAISQGSLRRGSAAVYIDIHHPEIEEFLEIRKPTGDMNRRSLNLHHGICIGDDFMHAIQAGTPYGLRSPKSGEIIRSIDARSLWQKILEVRLQTGEPYLLFTDTVNQNLSPVHDVLGLKVNQSNLCTEILLPTGKDHLGNQRTAVCCLSSLNLEKYMEWTGHPTFIEDVMRMLDNVLDDFISKAPASMKNAVYSATRERSIGLGVMGFHSFLQSMNIPFDCSMAKSWNSKIFEEIARFTEKANTLLALEKGSCPDAIDANLNQRFSYTTAIAPTASISIICGGTSPGIEPIPANVFVHKTLSGSFVVKNTHLELLLDRHGMNTPQVWDDILEQGGSVQHLGIPQNDLDVFKTAFEIDQRWVVDLASDRAPLIDQGQSVNLFLPSDVHKRDLHMLHYRAWMEGVKSLYYLRSKSIQRAAHAGSTNYDECLACQ